MYFGVESMLSVSELRNHALVVPGGAGKYFGFSAVRECVSEVGRGV